MYTTIFFIIIAFIIGEFAIEQYLDYRNRKASKSPIPKEAEGIYNEEEYAKQQSYFAENNKFGAISDTFSLAVTLIMFFCFGFKYVDDFIRSFGLNPIWNSVLFFSLLFLGLSIIGIPFSWYKNFVIEEKFGFNKMTTGVFVSDTIKNLLLSTILSGVVIAALSSIYSWLGENYWIIGWIVLSAISIFMMMFYASIIVPMFNKLTPLPEGELRNAIEDFCKKVDFKLDNLFVIDGSKRSAKANAFFSGLGSKKKICLYDTLIDSMTTEEIVAVLAHEIGHYKKKHTLVMLVISLLNTGLILSLSSVALGSPESGNLALSQALGSDNPSFHFSMVVFMLLFTPVSTLIGFFINKVSRRNEYQADDFAREHGYGDALVSALRKLTGKSLSNLTPDSLYVAYHFNHPTLVERVRAIKSHNK